MHRSLALVGYVCLMVLAEAASAAPSPSPGATPGFASASPVGSVSTTVAAASPSPAVALPTAHSPSPTPRAEARTADDRTAADGAAEAPLATALPVRPRTFRTPERAAPPAFVAPDTGAAEADGDAEPAPAAPAVGSRPATRSSSGLVVLRVSARTALEGFDLRVGYPRAVGAFGSSTRAAECNAGTGTLVVANDRGAGELRVLVASAQALTFPLDVFCRFTIEPGAAVTANDFTVRVAEVTSDGKRADPGLLLVSVVVR